MLLTLSLAGFAGNAKNCKYPKVVTVDSAETLKEAVKEDHICGVFKNNYRNKGNFIRADCVVMDCDNDHTDDEDGWIEPQDLQKSLVDVALAVVPSRHHLLPKGEISARPRFHVYFQVKEIDSDEKCVELKKAIKAAMPFFDSGAMDSARFIYGCETEVAVWQEGHKTIDEVLGEHDGFADMDITIEEGHRNSTMSRFAGRVLIRLGDCEKAYEVFLERAEKCNPPLEDDELTCIWNSARKFYSKVKEQEGYVPPESYSADGYKPEDYTDIGQAKVLANHRGDRMKYTPATDFLCYDGVVWVESKTRALGVLEEFMDEQLADAEETVADAVSVAKKAGITDEQIAQANKRVLEELEPAQVVVYKIYLAAMSYKAFVLKRRDVKYMQSALIAVKPMVLLDASDLDKNELLLNTPEATYFLPKGMNGAQEHNGEDMLTKVTAFSPSNVGKEIWQKALDVFFCNDVELKEYVQLVVGSAMVGKVYAERMLIAYGDGANGKSTFWNAVARVMGTYSGNLSSDALTMGCKRNVKPELAEIRGKRLIISSELQEGTRLNTSVVKQLCSTDDVYAEKKYKDPFSFHPSHTLVLYTNHLPRVGAMDNGIWRRLIVIPFDAKIEGKSDIKDYASYLVDNAGGAIMAWLIEGAEKAIACSFRIPLPRCVRAAVEAYKASNDWMGIFIEECCYVDKSYQEKSGELYQGYRQYCAANGEFVRSTSDFYAELERIGFERKKTKKGIVIRGIMLKNDDFLD